MALHEFRNLRPAGAKILVLLDAKEAQSPGGIIIPDGAQDKAVTGQVRGIGIMFDKEDTVAVGDKVLLSGAYAGSVIGEVGGQELVTVEYDELLAVLG